VLLNYRVARNRKRRLRRQRVRERPDLVVHRAVAECRVVADFGLHFRGREAEELGPDAEVVGAGVRAFVLVILLRENAGFWEDDAGVGRAERSEHEGGLFWMDDYCTELEGAVGAEGEVWREKPGRNFVGMRGLDVEM